MRWETIPNAANEEIYHLCKDDKVILSLTLHPFSKSARVECREQKRIFQIRKEGFRRNKTVLRNEYGIKIGELGQENKENFIDINNERFYYSIQDNPAAELVLYKESKDKPVISCSLAGKNGDPSVRFSKDHRINDSSSPGLIMAMCWYMFLPVAKENVAEVSAAVS